MSRPDLNFIEDDLAGDNNSEHLTDLYDDDQDLFSDSRTNKKGKNDLIIFILTLYRSSTEIALNLKLKFQSVGEQGILSFFCHSSDLQTSMQ